MLLNVILILLAFVVLSFLSANYHQLKKLNRKENHIMANQQALDDVLVTLNTTVAALGAGLDRLVADFEALKNALPPEADLSAEVASVQAAIDALKGKADSIDAADPAPAAPVETPPVEEEAPEAPVEDQPAQ